MKFNLTVKQRLFALSFGCIAFMAAVAATGYLAVSDLIRAKDEILLNGSALQHQLEADMAHDALRGDVLAAFLVSTKKDPDKEEVRKATKEHAQNFRHALKELEQAQLDGKIKQALEKCVRQWRLTSKGLSQPWSSL
jgi:hypothetical protein